MKEWSEQWSGVGREESRWAQQQLEERDQQRRQREEERMGNGLSSSSFPGTEKKEKKEREERGGREGGAITAGGQRERKRKEGVLSSRNLLGRKKKAEVKGWVNGICRSGFKFSSSEAAQGVTLGQSQPLKPNLPHRFVVRIQWDHSEEKAETEGWVVACF